MNTDIYTYIGCRCLHTATLALEGVQSNATNVEEFVRETLGMDTCDARRSVSDPNANAKPSPQVWHRLCCWSNYSYATVALLTASCVAVFVRPRRQHQRRAQLTDMTHKKQAAPAAVSLLQQSCVELACLIGSCDGGEHFSCCISSV